MAKYNVHYGVRLVYDVRVEANNKDEAIQKAKSICETTEFQYMDFVKDDFDAWRIED